MITKRSRKRLARDEKVEMYGYVHNIIADSKHVISRWDQTEKRNCMRIEERNWAVVACCSARQAMVFMHWG